MDTLFIVYKDGNAVTEPLTLRELGKRTSAPQNKSHATLINEGYILKAVR